VVWTKNLTVITQITKEFDEVNLSYAITGIDWNPQRFFMAVAIESTYPVLVYGPSVD
jgi:hypothetical protein